MPNLKMYNLEIALFSRVNATIRGMCSVEHYITFQIQNFWTFFHKWEFWFLWLFKKTFFCLLVRSHTSFFDVISLKNGNANLINGCPETWKFMKWWLDGSASASVLSFHPPWHAGWWMADGAHCILILRNMDTSGWSCKYQSFSSGRFETLLNFLHSLTTKPPKNGYCSITYLTQLELANRLARFARLIRLHF